MINAIVVIAVFVVAMTDASSIGKKVLVNADDRARYVLFFRFRTSRENVEKRTRFVLKKITRFVLKKIGVWMVRILRITLLKVRRRTSGIFIIKEVVGVRVWRIAWDVARRIWVRPRTIPILKIWAADTFPQIRTRIQ